jgi:hypothetical protein
VPAVSQHKVKLQVNCVVVLLLLLQRPRRTRRSFIPWFVTLVLVGAAWFKLFTLSSILNKMAYQGTW